MEFSGDERADWRASPVTKAYLKELQEMASAAVASSRAAIRSGDLPGASENEGKALGYEMAINIAERP